MTAIYKMEQNPPKKGSGKKVVLHPRIIPWDTVSTDRLIEEASSRSTYTSGDLKGAVRLLSDMHELKTMPVERYKEPKVTDFSQEEKESRLLRYLERHAYITTLAYQGLNGCTQYLARKELKQFVADGILVEDGTRRMCIYVKRPEPAELPDSLVVDSNMGR